MRFIYRCVLDYLMVSIPKGAIMSGLIIAKSCNNIKVSIPKGAIMRINEKNNPKIRL